MERESGAKVENQTVTNTRVSTTSTRNTAMESSLGKAATCSKEIIKTMSAPGTERCTGRMEQSIKENGRTVDSTGKER
jgi:hypothetical protein